MQSVGGSEIIINPVDESASVGMVGIISTDTVGEAGLEVDSIPESSRLGDDTRLLALQYQLKQNWPVRLRTAIRKEAFWVIPTLRRIIL